MLRVTYIHVRLKWAVSVINKLRQRPTLLMTPRILSPARCAVFIADHRVGWSQVLSGKAYEPNSSRSVEKRNFTYPTFIIVSLWGWSHRNFVDVICAIKLESPDCVRHCLRDPMFSRFRRTLNLLRTDGRTHDDSKYRTSIASRG